MKKWLLLALALLPACNKAVVHGRERPAEPVTQRYDRPVPEIFAAAKTALSQLGYEIRDSDESRGLIRTGWTATRAGSHYTEIFDRKDYGTTGAYYRLDLTVEEREGKTEVSVAAPVKSLVPHQVSSRREERKVLSKIADLLRREDFEMTNVGTE